MNNPFQTIRVMPPSWWPPRWQSKAPDLQQAGRYSRCYHLGTAVDLISFSISYDYTRTRLEVLTRPCVRYSCSSGKSGRCEEDAWSMEELCRRLGVVVDATPSASVGLTTEEAERSEYHPQVRDRPHAEPLCLSWVRVFPVPSYG